MQKIVCLFVTLILISCTHSDEKKIRLNQSLKPCLIDANATSETKFLYQSLEKLSKNHVLYGHQDDMASGVNWWAIEGRSDIKEVCGTYPAVFGWELGNLGAERNNDSILFTNIKKWIIQVYEMGGANTVNLHFNAPISLNDSKISAKTVSLILPGGKNHGYFTKQLQEFAKFNSELVSSKGVRIPIILRMFHEQNANWYWWGKKYCTADEYKNLFRFTVNYLRDSLNVHNLIYIYAPYGQFEDYLDRYPGDDFVDIMGIDYYFRNAIDKKEIDLFTKKMIDLTDLAVSKNKLAAISETGFESLPDSLWHSKILLNPVKENKDKIKLGYFLVWRNKSKTSFFAPFAGHSTVNDFKKLCADTTVLFLNNIPDLYVNQ